MEEHCWTSQQWHPQGNPSILSRTDITLTSWPMTKAIDVIPANAGIQDFLDPDFRRGDVFILRQTLTMGQSLNAYRFSSFVVTN